VTPPGPAPEREFIAVLDFGGQYAHLIANRIRRLGVYSEILPPDAPVEELALARGLIFSGGPSSVYDDERPPFNSEIFELGVPLLGLCYGHHLMAQQTGGTVARGSVKEYGTADLLVRRREGPLRGAAEREQVWMSHGDQIVQLPPGFEVLASTEDCPVAAMGDRVRHYYGLQFHPEVTHTPNGMAMLESFVDLCDVAREWDVGDYIDGIRTELIERVGDDRVLLLVSGGVDSTVCFALLNSALGAERVHGIHIDNGLMRKNESAEVERVFAEQGYHNLECVDASERFLSALAGETDPEIKRQIIGRTFVEVAGEHLDEFDLDRGWLLAQGTIYPDTIETGGTRHAATIKTHHNRVEEIEVLLAQGKVVEPLAHLYKDEVREAGLALGLPDALVWRHPFPGPGLGVRLLCHDGAPLPADEAERLASAQTRAEVLAAENGYRAAVLPLRSVGVQGDFRTYAHPAALSGGEREWRLLEETSTRITNAVEEVNRIVYTLSAADPADLDLVAATVTRERLDVLREVDAIAMEILRTAGLERSAWQLITVLLPLIGPGGGESVVLRPVMSQEAMTARFADLPWEVVEEMTAAITALDGVSTLFYDITHKPPSTIEWE